VLALVTGLFALGLYYYGLQRTPALLASPPTGVSAGSRSGGGGGASPAPGGAAGAGPKGLSVPLTAMMAGLSLTSSGAPAAAAYDSPPRNASASVSGTPS